MAKVPICLKIGISNRQLGHTFQTKEELGMVPQEAARADRWVEKPLEVSIFAAIIFHYVKILQIGGFFFDNEEII